jgi:two-component system, chemotaxis family, sensor kinase CheA
MSPDFSPELQAELLDDFYTECDELLGNIRAQLNRLEEALRKSESNPGALESLYRNAHSFKGNSAIIGLRTAEQLAHAAEDVLRGLSRGEASLTTAGLDLLGSATQRLEQIVTAHRLHQPLPDVTDLVAQLESYVAHQKPGAPASSPTAPGVASTLPEAAEQVEAAQARHLLPWRATFSPTPALDQRGVNLSSVRARLSALGEIVSAAPSILPGGKMSFEFTVALRDTPADLAAFEADGIVLQPTAPAPEAPAAPASAAPSSMFIAPSHIVRVDLSRLDELMRMVGEMVIHRSRLEERIAHVKGDRTALQEVNLALGRTLRELREGITRIRLVPVAEIFTRLPFVVRDLARDLGKQVRLVLEGQDTEIDKYLVERLKEPLLHLVRNALSHGVETPAERVAAGKPAEATLLLRASTSGQSVVIEIRDDGRGVDARAVAARAARAGIPLSDTPTAAELLAVLCRPGFSTREEADLAAGRGVGMAVVHNTVRELGGSLSLESEPGAWTRFSLRLPLTLSIAETFLVSAAGQTCAVPQGFVEEVLQFSEASVRTIQDAEVISYRGGVLPLVRLRRLFGAESSGAAQPPLLVLSSERGLCGLVVDRIHGQREVVVRAMHDPLIQVPGVSGATELGDGRPVLILDAVALSSGAVRPRLARRDPRAEAAPAPAGGLAQKTSA